MNELISAVRKNSDIDGLRRVFTNFPPDLNAYFTALIYERIPRSKSNISDTASALKLAMVIHADARRPNSYGYPRSVVNFWLLQNGDLIEGMPWYDMDVRPYSTVECEHMVETTKRALRNVQRFPGCCARRREPNTIVCRRGVSSSICLRFLEQP